MLSNISIYSCHMDRGEIEVIFRFPIFPLMLAYPSFSHLPVQLHFKTVLTLLLIF